MTFDQVSDYPANALVSILCCTTPKSICYRGPEDGGRKPVTPSGVMLYPIHYLVEGRIVGTESREVNYLVLTSDGPSAILRQRGEGLKLSINMECRPRLTHVPLSAIKRVTFQSAL